MRTQLLTLDHLVQLMDPVLYLHLQSADSTNFFFFFRMLLVWYKREFEWTDVLRLWESLWTDFLSSNLHLFVALAILEKHRDVIMEHLKHFDEVLKYGRSINLLLLRRCFGDYIFRILGVLMSIQLMSYLIRSTLIPHFFVLKLSFAVSSGLLKPSINETTFLLRPFDSESQRTSLPHQDRKALLRRQVSMVHVGRIAVQDILRMAKQRRR